MAPPVVIDFPGAKAQEAPAVRMTGYRRRFGEREVVRHVDLAIAAGECVALLGASGSGKSTLLRALAGLDREAEGTIVAPAEKTLVFQDHRLLPWRRVWRNLLVGLRGRTRAQAVAALEEVGIAHLAEAWPATLSGGEAQRVALARAFLREPRLLLMDEPFGALDALTRLRMHALLRQLWRRHRPATLLVTHDVDEAIALADRVLVLSQGVLALDERVARAGGDAAAHLSSHAALRERLLRALGVKGGVEGGVERVESFVETSHSAATPSSEPRAALIPSLTPLQPT